MLNIRFETLNFVQFSWDAGFFFMVAYLQMLTILITHIVIIIFENLEDVLSIFLFYVVFSFFFVVVVFFVVDLHLPCSSALCTKLGGFCDFGLLTKSK